MVKRMAPRRMGYHAVPPLAPTTGTTMRTTLTRLFCALACLLACAAPAVAQLPAWPAKPVRIISVFPPGGSVDQVARILAQQLTVQTGQQAIVENKGGASGSIGTGFVAKAEPDG